MFWMPRIDPLPGYGTTSAIIGNCGFSVAPMPTDRAGHDSIVGVFSYIEDIPRLTFETALPWNWSDWPSYGERLAAHPKAVNFGALIGHLNLRITAMGADAWTRTATPAEIAHMAAMLDGALAAGALGLSTNFQNVDSRGLPLPTRLADDAEFEALLDVLAKHRRMLQFNNDEMLDAAIASTERMARLCGPRAVRVQYLHLPAEERRRADHGRHLEMVAKLRADGVDLWPCFVHRPVSIQLSLESCIVFSIIGMTGWHLLSNETPRGVKAAMMADPDWRARCRREWDAAPHLGLRDTERYLLRNSANGQGPVGVTLTQLVERSDGQHPSDVLADWWLANGIDSTVHIADEPMNTEGVARLVRDPHALGGVNDAGAHGQLFCGGGESATLFSRYVRQGLLGLEEVVQMLTGRQAEHYRLAERGVLRPGAVADVGVFALDEIDQREEFKVWDVPDGKGGKTWRYTRPPAPFRATIVAGTVTFDGTHGQTDALPGRMLTPAQ
jgi:N-acyl-D-aspartate/D-glutamate deacylase